MFLKMKTQMSFPKLMEELNGNIHYQLFCDILIDPTHPLTNYKLLDDIAVELAGNLKIQELQNLLAEAWKPYMKHLDTMFTDATCYESEMRYPIVMPTVRCAHVMASRPPLSRKASA